jgi:hypothetical protein
MRLPAIAGGWMLGEARGERQEARSMRQEVPASPPLSSLHCLFGTRVVGLTCFLLVLLCACCNVEADLPRLDSTNLLALSPLPPLSRPAAGYVYTNHCLAWLKTATAMGNGDGSRHSHRHRLA